MSGHRKKLEQKFSKKTQDLSKLADEEEEDGFIHFDANEDEQYQTLTKNLKRKRKAEADFNDYNEKTFKAKKVSRKDMMEEENGLDTFESLLNQ